MGLYIFSPAGASLLGYSIVRMDSTGIFMTVEKTCSPNVPDADQIKPFSKISHLLPQFDFLKFEMQFRLWLLGSHIKLITPTVRKNKAENQEKLSIVLLAIPEGIMWPQPPSFRKGNPVLKGMGFKKKSLAVLCIER